MKRIFLIALLLVAWPRMAHPHGHAAPSPRVRSWSIATFAGGCFWCMEADFEKVPGVQKVVSGYTGGPGKNPTCEDFAQKGQVEAIQVFYHSQVVTYQQLLDYFWRHVNPTDSGGQFGERGPQYRSAIFYHDEEQKRWAEDSKAALAASGRFKEPIVTEILPATTFYPAEEYQQDYAWKHPIYYKYYRWKSGLDQFLEKIWGQDQHSRAAANPVCDNKYAKPSDEYAA